MEASNVSKTFFQNRLLNLFLAIFVAYVLVLVLVRIFERRLIFFPNYPDRLGGDWHPRALPVQDVWLTASDGVKLHAWWIPHDNAKFTFLAFHGNASNIANRAPTYEFLRSTPSNILALEYRGYGHSEGKPDEAGIYRDAEAAYEYLVNTKRIDRKAIISFGQSLGSAVATHLAAGRQVAGIVLEAPFPSASRVARKVFWFLPGVIGCGMAQCGSCSVLLDGEEVRTCVTPVSFAVGKQVTTIEGLPAVWAAKKSLSADEAAKTLHPVQQAWIDEQVPQCGYCQSGMMIAAVQLLEKNPNPTVAQIKDAFRSEEHTSELQSLTNLVCRLLLEKKKKYMLRYYTVRS